MPGSRLNHTESKLKAWWENLDPTKQDVPYLRRVAFNGNPGLRGIQNAEIRFDYPLSVIVGRNGAGKTTVLAISALGFHRFEEHRPYRARRRIYPGENSTYYTFVDFFFKGIGDPDISGLTVEWGYSDGRLLKIVKQSSKWMRYERRPSRPVHYLGVIRCVPAIEVSALRGHFYAARQIAGSVTLKDEYRARLSEIMGKQYKEAKQLESERYEIRRCISEQEYSSFNMGAGEDILMELLFILQESPRGALIVIEEIELGLHPQALIGLAKHLQEIILDKKLQVIVSTHSSYFIDSVPREARILLNRSVSSLHATYKPTTRFAVGELSGIAEAELDIYCEDNFAAKIIESGISGVQRRRIRIHAIGSASELSSFAAFHLRAASPNLLLIVWDGDQRDKAGNYLKIKTHEKVSLRDHPKLNYCFLPGRTAPEIEVLRQLLTDEGVESVSRQLNEDKHTVADLIRFAQTIGNHREVIHVLGKQTNIEPEELIRVFASAYAQLSSAPLREVSDVIAGVLNGETVKSDFINKSESGIGDSVSR